MASGRTHDLSSAIALPFIYFSASTIAPAFALPVTFGFALGAAYLSPDLDLRQSRPSQRWSYLRWAWRPYQKSHRHRGFSHWPLLGSAERFAYVMLPILAYVAGRYGLSAINWPIILSIWVGIEAACILHLVFDYTPYLRKL